MCIALAWIVTKLKILAPEQNQHKPYHIAPAMHLQSAFCTPEAFITPFSQNTRWQQHSAAEASRRAAGDGLHPPVAARRLRRSAANGVGSGQPEGLEWALFSRGSARRDCTAAASSFDSAGRCGSASNVPLQDEDVPDNHPLRLLDSCARQGRQPMSSDYDRMAVTFISPAVQSSLPPAATCRSAAGRACSARFYEHVKEMHACGTGWHAP